ncbi:MAG: glycosyltransferase [Candidatus Eremiobacteraeota bacterium]|nr:glycosyltransferase [Candidatus Eremiobacteraeota bacterium]
MTATATQPRRCRVYCYPVSRNSTYVPLLFAGIDDRYERVYREDGSLRDAIDEIDAGHDVIVHVHWEEFVLRDCRSDVEADEAAATFLRLISSIRERQGSLVWTVHNELPHLIPYHRQFLAMRAALALHADAILVHDATSADVLASQVELDRSKVVVLPHPSYLGRHEDEAALNAGLNEPHDRRIQGFGWIRLQKGFGEMIGMLPADYLRSLGAYIQISGEDAEAEAVMAQQAARTDVRWDVRHVPDTDVPGLLRSAACVVLPYERVLTSGVALLAMSAGAMLVAVDVPQLRELLPERSRRFLYPRGDATAFRKTIDGVFALGPDERRSFVAANLDVARRRHPVTVSRSLAAIYDRVASERHGSLPTR